MLGLRNGFEHAHRPYHSDEQITYTFHNGNQRSGFRGHRCLINKNDREVDHVQCIASRSNASRANLERESERTT